MPTTKLSITLPKKVAEAVSEYSAELKISTSKFISQILEENLAEIKRQNIIEKINNVFQENTVVKEQQKSASIYRKNLPKDGTEW
ncbi:MAG: hypothetical protein KJ666_07155 [Bacteroidetes bacterium]|nr:hypothetical protein [Bacteroidota bacterium]MBU2584110.1 hypothetical protein [Bacteroidota bacterium]